MAPGELLRGGSRTSSVRSPAARWFELTPRRPHSQVRGGTDTETEACTECGRPEVIPQLSDSKIGLMRSATCGTLVIVGDGVEPKIGAQSIRGVAQRLSPTGPVRLAFDPSPIEDRTSGKYALPP